MNELVSRAYRLGRRVRHWIAHQFHWNYGDVYSWWDGDRLMMGFKCRGCDTISGVHEVKK